MGVVHKLKAEVVNFIIEQRKADPVLGCRKLSAVIEEKFQNKVSKSSINSVLKTAGLSSPVGRRQVKKISAPVPLPLERIKLPEIIPPVPVVTVPEPALKQEEPVIIKAVEASITYDSGIIILKAAEYLLNGSGPISEAIKRRATGANPDYLSMTNSLIYLPLNELGASANEEYSARLNELQAIPMLVADIQRILLNVCQEVRCIKANLKNGNSIFLDGQMHTIWPTQYIPFDFSATHYNSMSCINKTFKKNGPLVLFMAPGREVPDNQFFSVISNDSLSENRIERLTLYGNKFEEIESVPAEQVRGCPVIFGLWPWQFVNYRSVNKLAEFKPFRFEPLQRELYCAEIEISLSHHSGSHAVTLNGFAVKTNLSEKTRVLILTNSYPTLPEKDFLDLYLSKWPNLDEAYLDFNRKTEKFQYFSDVKDSFSLDRLPEKEGEENIQGLFVKYLQALDLYVKWHFSPEGYTRLTLEEMAARFYGLKVVLETREDLNIFKFILPLDYKFTKDLQYLCRRVNELGPCMHLGKRLWLVVDEKAVSI